jgi:peptidyl-prolyl cis-trans isomerase B (cyclophilin B)
VPAGWDTRVAGPGAAGRSPYSEWVRRPDGCRWAALLASVVLLGGCGQTSNVFGGSPSPTPYGPSSASPAGSAGPSDSAGPTGAAGSTMISTAEPGATTTCEYVQTGVAARPVQLPSTTSVPTSGSVTYVVTMTNGVVRLTLDRTRAPCTVHSFESLADQGFFTATRCPRLVDKTFFILQCGDPSGTGKGGPGYTFASETDGTESYTKGVVAMANSGPNLNGSQFFLVWDDSTSLDRDGSFTIFGTMDAASIAVVASMAAEGQDGKDPRGGGRPNNPCEIIRVSRG